MGKDKKDVFLALVRAGLWTDHESADFGIHGFTDSVDWEKVYQLAEKQSVIGLVLAGIEKTNTNRTGNTNRPPQELLLQWIGEVQMLEQTNKAMNQFIENLVGGMHKKDIYAILVKGQGVAQCYERPLWRSFGDVDLLLIDCNYEKAREYLQPLSSDVMPYERYSKHLGMTIESWLVEIHGTLRTGLSGRVDRVVDEVQKDVFYGGNARSWMNGRTSIFLPSPDNDVFFVFTHFLMHFYREGMNLRQICDWCRLLWTYKDSLNHRLLEKRIRKAGLMSEWKAFSAIAVEYLGMPAEAMPMYDTRFKAKGERILKHILKGEPYNVIRDTCAIAKIFPINTIKFAPAIFLNVNGLKIIERIFG